MADKYEHELPEKPIAMTDYIRMLGNDDASYKNRIEEVAAAFIELYDSTDLGGEARSVKTAIDSLYSSVTDIRGRVMTNDEFASIESKLGL